MRLLEKTSIEAGRPGLEPGLTDPKSAVLPIKLSPNTRRRAGYNEAKVQNMPEIGTSG